MSEKKQVTQQAIGFGFSVAVEREIRAKTGEKYPDKTIVKAALSGHASTFDGVCGLLEKAANDIKKNIRDLEGGESNNE